jgi:hypothetical protein
MWIIKGLTIISPPKPQGNSRFLIMRKRLLGLLSEPSTVDFLERFIFGDYKPYLKMIFKHRFT